MKNNGVMVLHIVLFLVSRADGQVFDGTEPSSLPNDALPDDTLLPGDTYLPDDARLISEHNSFCKFLDACEPDSQPGNLCCKGCSCEPTCVRYGTCCPDVIARQNTGNIPAIDPEYTCRRTSVRGLYNTYGSKFMMAGCPDGYPDDTVVDLCKQRQSSKRFEDIIPVNDNKTHNNYKNKHCAICNSAELSSLLFWNPIIECLKGVFHLTKYDTLLDDIAETDDCDIAFQFYDPMANMKECKYEVISECNQTGLWRTYDAFTERACHAYLAPFDGKFQNHFCAVCNEYEPSNQTICGTPSPHEFMTFTALLKLPSPAERQQKVAGINESARCDDAQIYDGYKRKCRDLVCHTTRLLTRRNCTAAYTVNSGMCYELFVELSPLRNGTFSATSLAAAFEEHLQTLLRRHGLSNTLYVYKLFQVGNASDVDPVDGAPTGGATPPPGSAYVAYALLYWQYPTDDYAFIQDLYGLYDNQTISLPLSSHPDQLETSFAPSLVRPRVKRRANSSESDYMLHDYFMDVVYEFVYGSHMVCAGDRVTVTPFLECPAVTLEADYTWESRTDGVTIAGLDWFVGSARYRESGDSRITVCADDFEAALRAMPSNQEPSADDDSVPTGSKVQGIVSFVLAILSVCCLLITFITYSLFTVLRGQPGKHNMVLCATMASAYLLYVFGVYESHLKTGCTILAVCIHFNWVFTFFWQNVCSFHMFRDFNNLTKSVCRARGARVIVVYLVYAVLGTVAVMAVNVGVTYHRTDGASFGYGPAVTGLCYLHDRYMVIYTVAIPLFLLVVANLAMFIVVIVRLTRVATIKRHVKNERNFLAIYAKLSTLTGLTWLVAIPLYVTRHEVFEYIFIVLNASQGVYIMVAFVCNTRVMNLYKGIWSKYVGKQSQIRSTELTNLNTTAPNRVS